MRRKKCPRVWPRTRAGTREKNVYASIIGDAERTVKWILCFAAVGNVRITGTECAGRNPYPYHGQPPANSGPGEGSAIRCAQIIRRPAKMMAQTEVENPMVTDWWWDEQEYRVPSKARMKRERRAYEEAEREGDKVLHEL